MSVTTEERPPPRPREGPTPRAIADCLDAMEVQVGTNNGPGIYIGPPGTDLPASTTTEFDTPWRCLGYLSDDGPTVGQSTDSESLTPWQSPVPIRTVITSREVTVQFVMWQLNETTLALYFDADEPAAAADGSIDFDVRTDQAGHQYAVAIDSRDGNRVIRVGFPRANLSDAGDMAITRGAAIPLDVTLSALEDNGRLAHIMLGPSAAGQAMAVSRNGTNGPSTVEAAPAPRRRRA